MITIEEGRKAYNVTRVGFGSALEVCKMKDHESAVAEFFAQAALADPIKTAKVFAAYPVLTERQLEDRRERELYAFGPADDDDEERGGEEVTNVASMRAHQMERERVALAQLRGEPV